MKEALINSLANFREASQRGKKALGLPLGTYIWVTAKLGSLYYMEDDSAGKHHF